MLELKHGATLQVSLTATDGRGRYITGGEAQVCFWRCPVTAPDQPPLLTLIVAWVPATRGYEVVLDTTALGPGTYTVMAEIEGITAAGPAKGYAPPQEFTVVPWPCPSDS